MFCLSIDLIFQTSGSSSVNRTNIDRANEILDFSWKPPSNLVDIEQWIETAIEVCLSSFRRTSIFVNEILVDELFFSRCQI